MSTGRRASVLAVFTIFCVNILTKSDKRFIISLQVNIGIQERGSRGIRAEHRETGCESPTQKRHCKVYVLSDWRRCAGHSRERGRLCGKNGRKPTHQVRIFGSVSFWRLSRRSVCECIKMFAPKLKMALVLFVYVNGGRVHAHSLLRKE